MAKTVKNMSFSKGACQQKKKKTPAASLKRRNNGLGLPIHIKKLPILLNIRYYILRYIYYLYILPIDITYRYYLYLPDLSLVTFPRPGPHCSGGGGVPLRFGRPPQWRFGRPPPRPRGNLKLLVVGISDC